VAQPLLAVLLQFVHKSARWTQRKKCTHDAITACWEAESSRALGSGPVFGKFANQASGALPTGSGTMLSFSLP